MSLSNLINDYRPIAAVLAVFEGFKFPRTLAYCRKALIIELGDDNSSVDDCHIALIKMTRHDNDDEG